MTECNCGFNKDDWLWLQVRMSF